MKVFILNPEVFVRRAFEEVLRKRGGEVLGFESIDDCFHFLKDFNPDVVVIDEEIASLLQIKNFIKEVKSFSQIPIISMVKSYESGDFADFTFVKPLKMASLENDLREIVSKKSGDSNG